MTNKWAVLTDWQDCWTVDGKPMRFATEQEAEAELTQHLDDCYKAYKKGYMSNDGSDCDYRIVEVNE